MTPTTLPLAGTRTCIDCGAVLLAATAIEGEAMSRQSKKRFLADARPARGVTEIAETLYKIPALLTMWTRCGKPNCHCTAGHLHGPYHVLHWRDGGVQRRRYVRARDVPVVQAILDKRHEQRRTERLALALSFRTWRHLARLVEDYEAYLRAEEVEL
jgi:hypothetical protein